MIEATSCGGVVIFRGKILVLYKSYRNKYEGWVLPKGTVEPGETYTETALREVEEETGVKATIIKYIGKSQYSFHVPEDTVNKDVHWYLMMADSYYSKPQREEYFVDSGYYKYHEAYHLLKFSNEKVMLEKAYQEYLTLKRKSLWGIRRNFTEGLGLEYAQDIPPVNETDQASDEPGSEVLNRNSQAPGTENGPDPGDETPAKTAGGPFGDQP